MFKPIQEKLKALWNDKPTARALAVIAAAVLIKRYPLDQEHADIIVGGFSSVMAVLLSHAQGKDQS